MLPKVVWLEQAIAADARALLPGAVFLDQPPPPGPPHANLGEAQAAIASTSVRYNAELFDRAPRLRIVARDGIGLDNVDVAEATRRGIAVTNTPDGPTESTAEHTVAMVMALAKRLKEADLNVAAGAFGPRSEVMGVEVLGATLGLVGLGRIGRRVAEIAVQGLKMRVVAHDPFVSAEEAARMGVEIKDLDAVVAEADFLSLHLPLTEKTRRLMDAERIRRMKKGSFLLNLARGGLVDGDALQDAVDRGHLAGAGLDVFDPEPPPPAAPIRRHPKILVTPHSATMTLQGRRRCDLFAVENVLAWFRGERPRNLVNEEVMKRPRGPA